MDLKRAADFIKSNKIKEVECVFPTINATLRGKVMRAHDFAKGNELRIARAVILQTINGQYCDDHVIGAIDNDTILRPDYATMKQLPWAPERVWVIHDCMNFDGTPSEHAGRDDPRIVEYQEFIASQQAGEFYKRAVLENP